MLRKIVAVLCALTLAIGPVNAQQFRPGQSPGFRSGFQFLGGAGGFPSPGAIVDYDFVGNRYSGPAITVSNASGGYVDDAAGNWTLVPPNTLRSSNKGVLIEGAQTNSIRNNSMQGASTSASSIVLPNNWTGGLGFSGGTAATPFVGVDSGIDVIEYSLSGTTPAAQASTIQTETNTGVAAATGQLWTGSFFYRFTSGSGANASLQIAVREYDASGTFLRQTLAPLANTAVSAQFTRAVLSATLGTSTAFVAVALRCAAASGAALNFSLRIGWPGLEQWNTSVTTVGGASSPIRTTNGAAVRAGDVVTSTLGSGLTAWTMAGLVVSSPFVVSGAPISELNDGTATNAAVLRQNAAGGNLIGISTKAGAQSGVFAAVASPAAGSRLAVAYAQDGPSASAAISVNGSAPSGGAVATSDQSPTAGLNALRIGSARVVGTNWSGYIERLAVYPYRAANSNLQQQSTLANWGG